MAVEIGALRALLSLDSAAFEKGAKRAQASMGKLRRGLTQTADRMKKIGRTMTTRMTAPIVAGTGLLVRSSLSTIDAQAKMAASLDTSVVSLQNLDRAASLAGVSQSDLTGSLERMTRRISLAAQEAGPAKDALRQLGLSAENLNNLPVDERIAKINTAISEMIPKAEQAGVASQIFGDRTGLAIMRLSPDTISQAAAEVQRFGAGVSDVDASKIEQANDAMSGLALAVTGLGNQMTVALAPVLTSVSEAIGNLAERFAALSPEAKKMIGIATGLAAALGPAAIAIGLMATGLAAVLSPIGLVVTAVVALTAAVIKFWPEIMAAKDALIGFGRDGIEWIKEKFNGLIDFFRTLPEKMIQVGEDLIEGLKDGILQKWSDVKSSVLGVGTSITDGFKGVFGIESPSKIFKEIGANLMAGLGIGVADGESLVTGPLNNAADRIKGSMEGVGDSFDATGDRFGDMVAGIVTGSQSIADALKNIGNQLISSGISGLASSLFKSTGLGDMFAGLFDGGGTIPGGKFGVVGERGPEIVSGPARVTSRANTAKMMGGGQVGAQSLNVTVTMDESTGALGAFVRNESGRVVAQATPNIVRQSVGATYERAKEVALP